MTKETKKKVLLFGGAAGLGLGGYFLYKKYVKEAKKATKLNKVRETKMEDEIDDDDDEFDDDLDFLDPERIDEIIDDVTNTPDDDEGEENDEDDDTRDTDRRAEERSEDFSDESEDNEDAEGTSKEEGDSYDDGESIWEASWDESDSVEEDGFYPERFERACREVIDCMLAYKEAVIDLVGGSDEDTGIVSAQITHLFYVYTNLLLASYVTYDTTEIRRNLERFTIIYRMFLHMIEERGVLVVEEELFDAIKEESLIDPQQCRFALGKAASAIREMALEYIEENEEIIDFEFALENFPYEKDDEGENEEDDDSNITVEAAVREGETSQNNSGAAPQKMRPQRGKRNRR